MYHVTNLAAYKATERRSVLGDQASRRLLYPHSLATSFIPLQLTHTPASPAHGLSGPFLSCVYLSLIKVTPSWPTHTGGPDSQVLGDLEVYSARGFYPVRLWCWTRARSATCAATTGLCQDNFSDFEQGARLACRFGYSRHLHRFVSPAWNSSNSSHGWASCLTSLWKVPWCWSKVLEHSELYSSTGACKVSRSLHELLVGSSFSKFLSWAGLFVLKSWVTNWNDT